MLFQTVQWPPGGRYLDEYDKQMILYERYCATHSIKTV